MKCLTCGLEIKVDCFTALIGGKEEYFHLRCKPVFHYYQFPREREFINGKEWL